MKEFVRKNAMYILMLIGIICSEVIYRHFPGYYQLNDTVVFGLNVGGALLQIIVSMFVFSNGYNLIKQRKEHHRDD